MKKVFLSIIIFCDLLWQSLPTWASAADFEEEIDKLILVCNGQKRYLENWTDLMKENAPDAQKFIGQFLIPFGEEKSTLRRSLVDFYVDRIYFEIIDRCLENLRILYCSESINKNVEHRDFQKALLRLGGDLLRAAEIQSMDVIEHAETYLSLICPGFGVLSNKQQKEYSIVGPMSGLNKLRLNFLAKICQETPAYYTNSNFSRLFYESFHESSVVIHYYNQAVKYADIARTLDAFYRGKSSLLDRKYKGSAGARDAFILDRVSELITSQNEAINWMVFLEEKRNKGQLLPQGEANELARLKKLYGDREDIIFLDDEDSFIQKQVEWIFPSKGGSTTEAKLDGGWDSPLVNKWKKGQEKASGKSREKAVAKKQPTPIFVEPKTDTITTSSLSSAAVTPSDKVMLLENKQDTVVAPYVADLTAIIPSCAEDKVEIASPGPESFEEDYSFDFDDWYRDNVVPYKQSKQAIRTGASLLTGERPPSVPVFSKGGAEFLQVVLGEGYQEITTTHFSAFLKQAGGVKVKMTQGGYVPLKFDDQSVETTYILPNLGMDWENKPFLLCHVHQPHSASTPFPRRTLYNFLRRDLLSAGYSKEKLGIQ